MRQVYHAAVKMIAQIRTARATLFPSRTEHEVVHDQLAAAAEQLGQCLRSAGRIEDVVLLHADPGQLAALRAQRVPLARESLLLGQQILARGQPLVSRDYLMLCHDRVSSARVRT